MVGEGRRRFAVKDDEVRLFAGSEAADFFRAVDRVGGVQRRRGKGLFDRKVHVHHAEAEDEGDRLAEA